MGDKRKDIQTFMLNAQDSFNQTWQVRIHHLPSGKLRQLLKMAINIVDLPKKMVIFHIYVTVYQMVVR